ncbi:hypothetical protein [Actinoplanes sp. GCM10030250]|uniref:hypothetical protein n=1 Tax=Actinoplanes sp. GCM10030250 TaxID=3273376 RepID=UPI00361F6DA9
MAWCFALGSVCFLIGPIPAYAELVGAAADAATFFIGSILFTAGGALQVKAGGGRAARWAAISQAIGTVYFNVSTFRAMQVAVSSDTYDHRVWRPDLLGSICFLISGVIAYQRAGRRGWQPAVNLLGCVFFGASAAAGYVLPATGSMVSETVANVNTTLGAACFLACAVPGLRSSRTSDAPAGGPG